MWLVISIQLNSLLYSTNSDFFFLDVVESDLFISFTVPPRQAVLIETSHSRSDTPPHQNSPRIRFQVSPPTVVPLLDQEFRQYLALEGPDLRQCKIFFLFFFEIKVNEN